MNINEYGIKFLSIAIAATVPAFGFSFVERLTGWYIDNEVFLSFVFMAITADLITGVWKHLKKGTFSFKEMTYGLLQKTAVVIMGYVLFEMIHQIVDDVEFIAIYFKVLLQLVVILYPAGSAMDSLSIITDGKFPPIGWMKKKNKFNEDLDLNNFKTRNDEGNDSNSST